MNKKVFDEIAVEVIRFEVEDVITTSSTSTTNGIQLPDDPSDDEEP